MKPLIVANWKCNPATLKEAENLFNEVKNTGAVICPPHIYLGVLGANGAQDVFWEDGGAYTGEISPSMLKNLGVEYVIVGHSERRKYFKETNEIVNKKLKAAMSCGLKPILCIDKISQLPSALNKEVIVAYEPLFAIGTGKPCSIAMAKKMRDLIKHPFVLYGGSVNSKNAKDYIYQAGFQGLLVGGASLNPKEFIDIVKNVC
ncbi:MAG: triose-phosphate isomerase [Candidatus Nealsonbacteria bacterium]